MFKTSFALTILFVYAVAAVEYLGSVAGIA